MAQAVRLDRPQRGAAREGLIAFLAKRLIELAGVALVGCGLTLLLALLSYDPGDPSYSHAVDRPTRNLLGAPGARLADILVQTLGLAAIVLPSALAAWGWRLGREHRLPLWWLRVALLPVATVLAAIGLGGLRAPEGWPQALDGTLGGVLGQLSLGLVGGASESMGMTRELAAIIAGSFATMILAYALALSGGELRGAGAMARRGSSWLWRTARRLIGAWLADAAERRAAAKAARRQRAEPSMDGRPAEEGFAPAPIVEPRRPPPAELVATRPNAPAKPAKRQGKLDLGSTGRYERPSLDLLERPRRLGETRIDETALAQNARLLESVLDDFGVKGQIVKVRPGPVVTLYELEPAPGTKTSRVIGLADDIARSMSAVSVRAAVIPGRNVIGIELPNATRETVYLRELLEGDAGSSGALTLVLGKDIGGTPMVTDLARMPHLLIAGTTGSGKSVAINTMILSLLYRLAPAECRFIMVDPKMLELSVYDGIPHLLAPVVTDAKKAVVALRWTVREMENRYRAMSKLGVRNIAGYNARLAEARKRGEVLLRKVQTGFDEDGKPIFEDQPLDLEKLPCIVVVIDEMADLMLVAGKEVEWAVQRLAQMARAAGIHLIMATQRPSVDVITGTIKANFPTRISFQVTSRIDSRTILGEQGAEQLLGQGDMLYMAGGGRITRVHGPFVSDREVENIVRTLKAQGAPDYVEDVTAETLEDTAIPGLGGGEGGESDALYDQAVALVARERKASTSFVQRHLQIGYNRAARIIERMEAEGVVSAANHVGKREVLAPKGAYNE